MKSRPSPTKPSQTTLNENPLSRCLMEKPVSTDRWTHIIYTFVRVHIYLFIHTHAQLHIYIYTHIHAYIHTYIYIYTRKRFELIHVCTLNYLYTYICIYIYIYASVCVGLYANPPPKNYREVPPYRHQSSYV